MRRDFLAYIFFSALAFYLPIQVIFFRDVGIATEMIFWLLTLYTIFIVVGELPSGFIADWLGAKSTLLVGTVCNALSPLLFAISDGQLGFLIAGQLLLALSLALRSGTDSAFLYESIKTDYPTLEATSSQLRYAALGGSSLLGALLYSYWLPLPFLLSSLSGFIALLFLWRLPSRRSKPQAYKMVSLEIWTSLIQNPKLRQHLAFSSLLYSIGGFLFWIAQLYLDDVGLPTSLFGLVFSFGFLASVLGAQHSKTLFDLNPLQLYFSLGACLVLSMSIMLLFWHPLGFIGVVVLQYFTGLAGAPLLRFIQDESPHVGRASTLSLNSLLQRLGLTVILPVAGWSLNIMSLRMLILLTLVIFVLSFIAFRIVFIRPQYLKVEDNA